MFEALKKGDPELAEALQSEINRQANTINLIAAENYASGAVLETQGSVLTNKYAEGYPGRRYYGGCEVADVVESLAIERARTLFGAEHANVQPHSGSQANLATYYALLNYGDRVLAMSLAQGGHLTHGTRINSSGRLYQFTFYGVERETERLDYDEVERLALAVRPKLIVAGASAYSRAIDFQRFRQIADLVGARLMVDMAHVAGLVAAGLHSSPVPHADVVTSTTHKTLRGPRGGFILCRRELASNIDAAVFPGVQGGPLMHIIAAKAVAFHEALQPEFVSYQRAVLANVTTLCDELQTQGLRLVSGGSDNHLVLVDLGKTGLTGRAAEEALAAVGIIVNRNAIPFDTLPLHLGSGIRLGAAAVTSRGFTSKDMRQVASWIASTLSHPDDEKMREGIRRGVREMCALFPMPGG